MWMCERAEDATCDQGQRFRAVDEDLDRIAGTRRRVAGCPASSGIECVLPADPAKPPAVMAGDLVGDRLADQALGGKKRLPETRHSDPSITGVAQRVDRERDEARGDDSEQKRAIGVVASFASAPSRPTALFGL